MKDKLSAFERRLEMLFLLNKCRETTALELSYYFAVSKDTIFRDIDFLNRYAPIYTKRGKEAEVVSDKTPRAWQ